MLPPMKPRGSMEAHSAAQLRTPHDAKHHALLWAVAQNPIFRLLNVPVLVTFISCQKLRDRWPRIRQMAADLRLTYVIVSGGSSKEPRLVEDVLWLPCDDSYAGLPSKMHMLFDVMRILEVRAAVKIDDDVQMHANFVEHMLGTGAEYAGWKCIKSTSCHGDWHVGRCPGSVWNQCIFDHAGWCQDYDIPLRFSYADGGSCYMVKRQAIKVLATTSIPPASIPYEDMWVAAALAQVGIHARPCMPPGGRFSNDGLPFDEWRRRTTDTLLVDGKPLFSTDISNVVAYIVKRASVKPESSARRVQGANAKVSAATRAAMAAAGNNRRVTAAARVQSAMSLQRLRTVGLRKQRFQSVVYFLKVCTALEKPLVHFLNPTPVIK